MNMSELDKENDNNEASSPQGLEDSKSVDIATRNHLVVVIRQRRSLIDEVEPLLSIPLHRQLIDRTI
ncbi:hypothetical protein K2173_015261 [Erythroxylum novogranatense]|uniref:Uncharacterized protein n=1 Tax=Erythroxylum novogranatense TaxID=1862640 RepID=A0AAV8T2I7_9ROSI|nr:hypothetical protein K2173_015261 [Erythroxylum novogranatense]